MAVVALAEVPTECHDAAHGGEFVSGGHQLVGPGQFRLFTAGGDELQITPWSRQPAVGAEVGSPVVQLPQRGTMIGDFADDRVLPFRSRSGPRAGGSDHGTSRVHGRHRPPAACVLAPRAHGTLAR